MSVAGGVGGYFQALAGLSYMTPHAGSLPKSEDEALKRVATEFESIFAGELLKASRSTVFESGLFGNDRCSKMYREMYDEALASSMAETGQLGIGKMLYTELRRGLETKR